MAETIQMYNHTAKLFANGEVDIDNCALMLLDGGSFNAAHTDISSLSGDEVSGNGWTSGGEVLSSATVSIVDTNDAVFDADDVSVMASGGPIGPADTSVIYDKTSDKVLFFVTFDGEQKATAGNLFEVTWNAGGIGKWTVT